MRLNKLVQKRLYDVLSSKQSLLVCFCGCILLFIAAFHFGETLIFWSHERYKSIFLSYKDNIAEKNFHDKLCQHLPIDVVYTWVNGSDPELISQLHDARDILMKKLDINATGSTHCTYSHCVTSYFAIIQPVLPDTQSLGLKLEEMNSLNVSGYFQAGLSQGNGSKLTVLRFKNIQSAIDAVAKRKIWLRNNVYSVSDAYITDDWQASGGIPLKDTYIMTGVSSTVNEPTIKDVIPLPVQQVSINEEKKLAVITLGKGFENQTEAMGSMKLIMGNKTVTFSPAYLVAKPLAEIEDVSTNRFADNEELRYSLRSLMKHAPWIRQVFLVTNGQIPHWLDLDNPRIKIITHEEIFGNQSHLPTFSSPAIESHLHKIPGVSKRFIYLNDDVFFGKTIWPEDFYTESKGHKVYLSWPVPDCADGCPTSWIRDGYCDRTCNNSNCEWDGGDCVGDKIKYSYSQLIANKPNAALVIENINKMYCSQSCTNSWLGDRYCDQACNVKSCGFDAGDCGVDHFNQLHEINLTLETKTYHLPPGVAVAYFNISTFLDDFGPIQSGLYADVSGVRSIAISIKFKVLTLVLQSNFQPINVTLNVKSSTNEYRFVIRADTRPPKVERKNDVTSVSIIEYSGKSTIPEGLRKPKPFELDLQSYAEILNHYDLGNPWNESAIYYNLTLLEQYYKSGYLTELGYKVKKAKLLKSHLMKKNAAEINEHFTMKKLQSTNELYIHYSNVDRGFLPWEKKKSFAYIENVLAENAIRNWYKLSKYTNRRLRDTFGDSLRHVNRIYNSYFGYEARKVPAHMAHFIDVNVMNRLHKEFPEEFDMTSSHKIRSPSDMQFAFSYYYFLTSEMKNATADEIFDSFDVDNSGTWSDREIRTLLTRIYDLPLQFSTVTHFESVILNCSNNEPAANHQDVPTKHNERYLDSNLPTVTKALIKKCDPIVAQLLNKFGKEKRNQFEVVGEEEVAFKMIYSNLSLVLPHLDDLRKKPKKFVCLNDNIGHGTKDSELVRAVLKDFYESLFPFASPFELPPEFRNRFLRVDQLREWQNHKANIRIITYLIIIALISISAALFCASNIYRKDQKRKLNKSCFLFNRDYHTV